MNRYSLYLAVIFSVAVSSCNAVDTGARAEQMQASQKPIQVNDAEANKWIALMSSMLPNRLCKQNSFFLKCFNTNEEQCEIEASLAVHSCLKNHQEAIRADFRSSREDRRELGRVWGTKIGECAGAVYELSSRDKAVANATCSESTQTRSST